MSTPICPSCKRPLTSPSGLLFDLFRGKVTIQGLTATLTRDEAVVFHVLLAAYPVMARHTAISAALWGGMHGAENESDVIKTHICRMRKKLSPIGIAIETKWRVGYGLTLPLIEKAA